MDKLQEIKEKTEFNHFHMPKEGRFSLAFNLRKDNFDWLIAEIERLRTIEQAYEAWKSAK